jgi:hypothetical protein
LFDHRQPKLESGRPSSVTKGDRTNPNAKLLFLNLNRDLHRPQKCTHYRQGLDVARDSGGDGPLVNGHGAMLEWIVLVIVIQLQFRLGVMSMELILLVRRF